MKRERALLHLPGAVISTARLVAALEDDGFSVELVPGFDALKQAVTEGRAELVISTPPASLRELSALVRLGQRGTTALVFGAYEPIDEASGHLRPWPCAWIGSADEVSRAIATAYATRDALAQRTSAHLVAALAELGMLASSSRPASELVLSLLRLCSEALGARELTLSWSAAATHRLRETLEDRVPSPEGELELQAQRSLAEARAFYAVDSGRGSRAERLSVPIFGPREVIAVLALERRGAPVGRGAMALLIAAADQLSHQLERSRLADVLEHRERLASLGELMASVVHELNSPVGYVRSNLETLQRQFLHSEQIPPTLRDDVSAIVDDCVEGMDRMAGLVQGIRIGSRQPKAASARVELAWIAAQAAQVVKTFGERMLELRVEQAESRPVQGDAGRLLQVVQNLLMNAVQATGPGGRVVLRTGMSGASAFLEVTDDGPGVPPHLAERIFDAFFTTKPADSGTGLGLAICRRIAREHGGDVSYRGAPGGGACFRLTLPVDREEASATPNGS